jgi:hypothetical protein
VGSDARWWRSGRGGEERAVRMSAVELARGGARFIGLGRQWRGGEAAGVGARPVAIDGAVSSGGGIGGWESEGEGRRCGGSAISGGVEGQGSLAGGWR